MSDFIVCPVCETQNPLDATHCEVCGERLTPAQPGEEINPEENVAAMIADAAAAPAADQMGVQIEDEIYSIGEDPGPDTALDDDFAAAGEAPVEGGFDMDDEDDFDLEPAAPSTTPAGDDMGHDEDTSPEDDEDAAPAFLYSPMTGEAYPQGSPEYEEGFGPMGEQLVAEPPAEEPAVADEAPAGFEDDAPATLEQDYEDEPILGAAPAEEPAVAEPAPEPEPVRESPFKVAGPNPEAPLPSPGTYEEPATLTLYYQRQPVLEHPIETDETLIGRKDIRADIHPDIDLTEYDPESYVSRKHAYVYRQNKNYTIYAISNGGVQLNNDMLDLGDRRPLKDGDVIVIAGILAFKFQLPA